MRDCRAARQCLVGAGMLPDGRTAFAGTEAAGESQAQQPTKGKVRALSSGPV